MLNELKIHLGVFFPIIMLFLTGLLILTTSRLLLCLWKNKRVTQVNGWKPILLSGLRMDVVTLCYLVIVPCLFTPLLLGIPVVETIWLFILQAWIIFFTCLLVFMEVTTPGFINEFDVRPNRFFIEYLIYPKEVLNMMVKGYKLQLLYGGAALSVTLYFMWGYSTYLLSELPIIAWYWHPIMALSAVAICVLGARSSLGHRGINPSMVAFSHDTLMNDLIVNSTYSVIYAAKLMRKQISSTQLYPPIPQEAVIKQMQDNSLLSNAEFKNPSMPSLAFHSASHQVTAPNKPKNIVILLQESLGSRYVGHLGGLPLTPNLDALMQESWTFSRCYATGTRSIRGIEAVTTGFFPTPGDAVVKLSKSQTGFYSIAQSLKSQGYHTQFVYGGESHFDNMKGFLLGNGVVDIQDLEKFETPELVGSWGACDGDLYTHAHKQFMALTEQDKPFFSLVFTTSNHSPYEYPEGKIELYNQPAATVENTVKYTDHELGQFIQKAKQSDYWHNTIFVVVADHDSRVYGDQLVPMDGFRIPAVIFGGGVEAKQDDRLISQVDLAPTLLSLAGVSCEHPMLGHDLTKEIPKEKRRALMQYHHNFAWLNEDNQAVIFQPQKDAVPCQYDPNTHKLTECELPQSTIDTAHAFAMWGSVAYREDFYCWDNKQK